MGNSTGGKDWTENLVPPPSMQTVYFTFLTELERPPSFSLEKVFRSYRRTNWMVHLTWQLSHLSETHSLSEQTKLFIELISKNIYCPRSLENTLPAGFLGRDVSHSPNIPCKALTILGYSCEIFFLSKGSWTKSKSSAWE